MKYLIITLTLLSVVGIAIVLFSTQTTQPQKAIPQSSPIPSSISNQTPINTPVEYTARFLIFTHGTKRIFTDSKYHNQSEEVFIESTNPSVVHIQQRGITWGDFFDTLPAPMNVTDQCLSTGTGQQFCTSGNNELRFYINGVKKENALTEEINPNDQLLVSYGNESKEQINQQIKELEL